MPRTKGRPTRYNKKISSEILFRLTSGESLMSILREKEMPCIQTFYNWLDTYPDFLERYQRSREIGLEVKFEEINDLALQAIRNKDMAPGLKILADQKRWEASKRYPAKYGDRQQIEHSGTVTQKTIDLSKLSDKELQRLDELTSKLES